MKKTQATIGIAAAALVACVTWFLTSDWRAVPDRNAMRQYRARAISDEQIRDLHAAARESVEQARNSVAQQSESTARETAEMQTRCSDIAFQEKNPARCRSGGLVFTGYRQRTVEEIFELAVLGPCAYVETVREAKKRDCLPN